MAAMLLEAQGREEDAASEYLALLTSEEALAVVSSPQLVHKIVNRLSGCYIHLTDWKLMADWTGVLGALRHKAQGSKLSGAFAVRADSHYIQALAAFDSDDVGGARKYAELMDVRQLGAHEIPTGQVLQHTEMLLLRAMLAPDTPRSVDDLAVARAALLEPLRLEATESVREAYAYVVQLSNVCAVQASLLGEPPQPTTAWLRFGASDPNVTGTKTCMWSQILRVQCWLANREGGSGREAALSRMEYLRHRYMKLARHQGNLRLAARLLDQASPLASSVLYERCLLLSAKRQTESAVTNLWHESTRLIHAPWVNAASGTVDLHGMASALLTATFERCAPEQLGRQHSVLGAKTLIRIGSWLLAERSSVLGAQLYNKIFGLDECDLDVREDCLRVHPPSTSLQLLGGGCFAEAAHAAPMYARSWFMLAGWCYRFGRHHIEKAVGPDGSFALLPAEAEAVGEILLAHRVIDEHFGLEAHSTNKALCGIIAHFCDMETRALVSGAGGTDPFEVPASAKLVLSLMRRACAHVNENCLEQIVREVWLPTRRRIVRFYCKAVEFYLRYLHLGSNTHMDMGSTDGADDKHFRLKKVEASDRNSTATLRLLRLLVKYGVYMPELFSVGFESTPTRPWREVIPQLFARLGNNAEFVRAQVQVLIARIGDESPHSVVCALARSSIRLQAGPSNPRHASACCRACSGIERADRRYPAVVGANEDAEGTEASLAQFELIKSKLAKNHAQMMQEIELLIAELSRITVLWDEQWLSTLHELTQPISSRLRTIDEECARVRAIKTLTSSEKQRIVGEKYAAIMKPMVVALEKMQQKTYARAPETPHEEALVQRFAESLDEAIRVFKEPPSAFHPAAAYEPLRAVLKEIALVAKSPNQQLHRISKKLVELSQSQISMPGLVDSVDGNFVTIDSFDDAVAILPTKTKPKKLMLTGSDGKRCVPALRDEPGTCTHPLAGDAPRR
jgi:PI-3-kinase-related kinase SMG-1